MITLWDAVLIRESEIDGYGNSYGFMQMTPSPQPLELG